MNLVLLETMVGDVQLFKTSILVFKGKPFGEEFCEVDLNRGDEVLEPLFLCFGAMRNIEDFVEDDGVDFGVVCVCLKASDEVL